MHEPPEQPKTTGGLKSGRAFQTAVQAMEPAATSSLWRRMVTVSSRNEEVRKHYTHIYMTQMKGTYPQYWGANIEAMSALRSVTEIGPSHDTAINLRLRNT
ncbi:hypothetical protein BIFGAL_03375 [Bifidobacterium gallicum DSM 20093 = LMG 11596]|uniref:Uncharacterized protein n=1 Tax=Bifidobacterium gallicum DSM 20093 = LMG 11596 TaxID=561180 RepID=D1NU54_9BIFI|nr:hypothetical protein BIFGAL_03375 [Bifidobacterium gallicum DSM 20093 = LMG 11596]